MTTASPRHGWWGLLLAVVGIKSVLLLLDPIPKLFFGDSGSFIVIAVLGLLPHDRSAAYGYVLRLATFWADTLAPLLVLQTAASAACALLLVWALRKYLHVAPYARFCCRHFVCA